MVSILWSLRKKVLAALKKSIDLETNITISKNTEDPRRFQHVKVAVYETVLRARCDSTAIPNFMPADLCSQLHLQPSLTNGRKKVPHGTERIVGG